MTPTTRSLMLFRLISIALLVVLTFSGSIFGQDPEIIVSIDDTSMYYNDGQGMFTISLSNLEDTVAGFSLWFLLGNPDYINFSTIDTTVVDTTYWYCINWDGEDCLEYIPVFYPHIYDSISIDTNYVDRSNVDTSGTLTSGWQYLTSRSISGMGTDLKTAGIANMPPLPIKTGIIPQDDGLLFKVPFDILQEPLEVESFTSNIIFNVQPEYSGFSDPSGNLIGLTFDTLIDTSLFRCNQWVGDECLDWQQVAVPPYDSMTIDTGVVPNYDPSIVEFQNGTITIIPEIIPDLELFVTVNDVTVDPNDGEGMLTIQLSNIVDSIAGFELFFELSHPDAINFMLDTSSLSIDTTYWQCLNWIGSDCIESLQVNSLDPYDWIILDTIVFHGVIDTTNTLLSDWQYIESRSYSSSGPNLRVVGISDMVGPPYQPGFGPQENGTLIKIPFEIVGNPTPTEEFYVDVHINRMLDNFGFATPQGELIGISYDTTMDTAYYICLQWAGDECLSWQRVSEPPYDSMYVYQDVIVPYFDTNKVKIQDGIVTILPGCAPIIPGDVDDNGIYDISDLSVLIDFVLNGGPPLLAPRNADVDGNCSINWDDVNLLTDGGPFTDCACLDPEWVCCIGLTGNANYDRYDNAYVNDLTFLVNYIFKGGPPPPCIGETLINPYTDNTIPLVSDLTHMVNYIFKGGEDPDICLGQ